MDKNLSDKLRVLSSFSIIMVVYIHSYYLEGETYELNKFIQNLIGQGICRVAVPLFFTISGYLFFININDGLTSVLIKIRKRAMTLLIPYIICNVWFVLVYMLLHFTPAVAPFVNNDLFGNLLDKDLWSILYALFVDPAGFHLWFLRDLMLVVLCTPLIYYLMKYMSRITIIVLFFISLWQQSVYDGFLFALTWFTAGACLAVTKTRLQWKEYRYSRIIGIMCLCCLVADSVCRAANIDLHFIYYFVAQILGVISVWLLYDYVVNKDLSQMKLLNIVCRYTFFIYLFHEPTLNILKKLPPVIWGQSAQVYLICYLVVPWLMIALATIVGFCLNRFISKFYSILVGGR